MSIYHAALAAWPKITYQRSQKLFKYFPNFNNLWEAEWGELSKAGLEDELAQEFITWREQNPPEKLAVILDKEKLRPWRWVSPATPGFWPKLPTRPFLFLFAVSWNFAASRRWAWSGRANSLLTARGLARKSPRGWRPKAW